MSVDTARVRELVARNDEMLAYYADRGGTHYEGCQKIHPLCALADTTRMLSRLVEERDRLAAPITAEMVAGVLASHPELAACDSVANWCERVAQALNRQLGR